MQKYTPTVVRMSTLVCANHGAAASAAGALVLALLAILHVSLLVAPMLLIVELFDPLAAVSAAKAGATRRNGVTAPGVLLAAMAVFCVASLGEIALHVQQIWVELGLMPSWYNVVFYGALALGQVRLPEGDGCCSRCTCCLSHQLERRHSVNQSRLTMSCATRTTCSMCPDHTGARHAS